MTVLPSTFHEVPPLCVLGTLLRKLLQARIIPQLVLAKHQEKFATKPTPEPRNRYPHFLIIPTRWLDIEVYSHLNNVIYYSYFDMVVNQYLLPREF